jgi:hypothetical protein
MQEPTPPYHDPSRSRNSLSDTQPDSILAVGPASIANHVFDI